MIVKDINPYKLGILSCDKGYWNKEKNSVYATADSLIKMFERISGGFAFHSVKSKKISPTSIC